MSILTLATPPWQRKPALAFAFAAFLLTLVFALNPDSLWIDEGDTAVYAIQPDFSAWRAHLLSDPNADCQMPLTMLVAWGVAKVFGSTELWLRAPNIFWGLLSIFALYQVGKRIGIVWLPLLLAIQPYFAFYTSEARPYAPQIAAGCLLVWALVAADDSSGSNHLWAWLLGIGTLFAFGNTILAPLTVAPVYAAIFLVLYLHREPIKLRALFPIILSWLACIPLAFYYWQTITRGAKGTTIWSLSPANLGFIGYEVLGFVGLGPGVANIRTAAREGTMTELFVQHPSFLVFGGLFLLTLAILAVLLLAKKEKLRQIPLSARLSLVIFGTTCVLFVLAALLLGKSFWARHLSIAFPFWIVFLGLALHRLGFSKENPQIFVKSIILLLAALWLFSSLQVRLSPRHAKDDYRTAANLAHTALQRGETVWWFGSWHCAYYYGLPIDGKGSNLSPHFFHLHNPSAESLPKTMPALVIYTKPDIYDAKAAGMAFLEANGFQFDRNAFPAFSLARKSASAP
jgi:4-amino-4-deoxy-L-arabinose transferase-like glycosyltransferase